MAKTVTFLQLSEEFGGTRFGPFDSVEIRLGSDPSRNDITLPEALGVEPEHVKILKQQDSSFIIAPVDRTTAVFFWRDGSRKSKQVQAPMAVQGGDGFSLVTPEGPRFYLLVEQDPASIAEAAKDAQGPGLGNLASGKGKGILHEIKRVGLAKVMTTNVGHFFQNAGRMVVTGQIFSPMYIVMGMTMASGWIFAGGASCTALSFNNTKGDYQAQLTNCKDQLGVDPDSGGDPTVPGLTRKILIDRDWQNTIETDRDLYAKYADKLREIFAAKEKYKWVYTKKSSNYARFKESLENAGMTPDLVRVMSYASALKGYDVSRDWSLVYNSDDNEACGRGPLNLTYAQGYRLGLTNLQLDALVDRQVAESNDLERLKEALTATANRIDVPTTFDADLIESASANLQGGMECIYVKGDDDRTNLKELATAIQTKLGAGVSKGLPREAEAYWIAARLTRLYAMDFRIGYDELKFDARLSPSQAMEIEGDIKKGRAEYAIKHAAEVIARAVAVPCMAQLDKEVRAAPPSFMFELPNIGTCAMVRVFVEYDML
jgi:hypothetical protein